MGRESRIIRKLSLEPGSGVQGSLFAQLDAELTMPKKKVQGCVCWEADGGGRGIND